MRGRALIRARRRGLLVALSNVVCLAVTSTVAAADEEATEAIHLRFEIEASLASQCPRPERFLDLLRNELPGLRLAPEDASARTFAVRIRRARDGLAGEVVVTAVDGRRSARTVAAHDCPMLTRALAVVAAVASHAVTVDEPKVVEPKPDRELPRAPADERPSGGGLSEERPASSASAADRRPISEPLPTHGRAWSFGAGLGTELVLGSLPRATMGYRGYFDARRALRPLTVGVRTSFAFSRAQQPGMSTPNVFVQTWTARVEGCAGGRSHASFSVELCASVTSGVFDAFGGELSSAHRVYPWLSFGGGGRARWHIGKAAYAEIFGNASHPTTTFNTVSRDTSAVVVRSTVPPLVGDVGLGIGYSFGGL